jgi:hypothetical protein
LLVAGLAAYALTQLLEAVFRPSRAESATGRWRQRAVSSWGCLLYTAFCLSTARLLLKTPPRGLRSRSSGKTSTTVTVLRTGWGRLLLILAGLLIMAAAVEISRRSVWLDFRERVTAEHMSRPLAKVTRAVGAYGCIARSVVLVLVGEGTGRGLPFGGQFRRRRLAVGFARVRPLLLRPLLPDRGSYCLIEARIA